MSARNRRLVPMPPAKKNPDAVNVPKLGYASPPTPVVAPIVQPIVPTFGNSWPYFGWLVVTAVTMYYLKWPILIIAAIVGFVSGWIWLSYRFPKTMWFVSAFLSGFLRGMMGRRRRR